MSVIALATLLSCTFAKGPPTLTTLVVNSGVWRVRFARGGPQVDVLADGEWDSFLPLHSESPISRIPISADLDPLAITDKLVLTLGDTYNCVTVLAKSGMAKIGKSVEIPGLGDACDADSTGAYVALSDISYLLEFRTSNLSSPVHRVDISRFEDRTIRKYEL
jgi:hypothetical protein